MGVVLAFDNFNVPKKNCVRSVSEEIVAAAADACRHANYFLCPPQPAKNIQINIIALLKIGITILQCAFI
jgi:hypothetical protein